MTMAIWVADLPTQNPTQVLINQNYPWRTWVILQSVDSHSQTCALSKLRVGEAGSRGTGTDAGALKPKHRHHYCLISTVRHTYGTHVATCKTISFPYVGFIPKIDIMFIYILFTFILRLHVTKNSHNLIQVQISQYYIETAQRVIWIGVCTSLSCFVFFPFFFLHGCIDLVVYACVYGAVWVCVTQVCFLCIRVPRRWPENALCVPDRAPTHTHTHTSAHMDTRRTHL